MPKKKDLWQPLEPDTQNLLLKLLWEDGHSEAAIATFFNTGKGRIVRHRQFTLKLETRTAGRGTIKPEVNRERFIDLLDLHGMRQYEAENDVWVIAPIGRTPLPPVPKSAEDVERPPTKVAHEKPDVPLLVNCFAECTSRWSEDAAWNVVRVDMRPRGTRGRALFYTRHRLA